MNTRIFTTVAIAAALTVSLAACAPATEMTHAPAATAPATNIDSMDLNADGKVTEHEKEIAARNAPREYTMPNGDVVSVDPTKPLPAEVKAVVIDVIAPTTDIGQGASDYAKAQNRKAIDSQHDATGRGLVVVIPQVDGTGANVWVVIVSNVRQAPVIAQPTREAGVAAAESYASGRNLDVIVMD